MPLTIEYRRIGQLPTCVGNERIRIAEDGHLSHSRNTAECEKGVPWSAPWRVVGRLDGPKVAQLTRDIGASGVLALPPASISESTEGGTREELDLTIDGQDHHLVVQNMNPPAFRAVVKLLWGAMFDLTT